MRVWLMAVLVLMMAGYTHQPTSSVSEMDENGDKAPTIVSLDYCADQYVLALAGKSQIRAVSPDAVKSFSYMRSAAAGIPAVRPLAEDIMVLAPDIVVRSYGGGPGAAEFFKRAGIKVVQIGYAGTLDDIARNIEKIGAALSAQDRAGELAAQMKRRMAALPPPSGKTALYVTTGGVTSGPGSLVDEMIRAAGYTNFETRPGWPSLPLERLAYERPDMIAAAFFESAAGHKDIWSPARHSVSKRALRDLPVTRIEGAWTACGGWFLMDAIEALAKGGDRPRRAP